MKIIHLSIVAILGFCLSANAQTAKKSKMSDDQLKRWSHLDLEKDSVPGMSVDRAYNEFLKGRKGVKVIVGIVDSGIDIDHPDLKSVVWTNKKEIAGNGKDDDKNGYIDDIHGWNFLGDITKENYEFERIVNNKSMVDEATYNLAVARANKKKDEGSKMKENMEKGIIGINTSDEILSKHFGKAVYTLDEVNAIETTDKDLDRSKKIMQQMLGYGLPVAMLKVEIQKQLDAAIASMNVEKPYVNYRTPLGDNPNDIKDKKYGNNNVIGPDKDEALHGTHVAGIVAQSRFNNIGGDGVANNVEILTVRAVPDGDEYDKDIALGIRYAVDNGAKVINGSFGKDFSPQKQWVYDAIKYAESKDVLIVHAAGNDAKDIDVENNFPNDSDDKKTEFASNLITIGALNFEYNSALLADFSNFGKINVDVFAPGVQIYATTPKDSYQFLAGTSMASPNVAGVAALIRSYFPKLSAKQVKKILMDSGTTIPFDVAVGGNAENLKPLSSLCVSGKIVNALNALKMAETMSKNKNIKVKG